MPSTPAAREHDHPEYVKPTSPAAYLAWHVLNKGWQLGSVLGVAAVVPFMMLVRPKTRDPTLLLRALGYSCLGGMTASGTLGAVKFSSIDEEGFEDRAYRLFYNKGQNRTDGFAAIGAAVGFAAAAVLARQSGLGALGGAAVGTAVGVAAHVATQPAEE